MKSNATPEQDSKSPLQRLEMPKAEATGQLMAAPAFGLAAGPAQLKTPDGKGPMQLKQAKSLTKCMDFLRMSDADLAEESKLVKEWLDANTAESPQRNIMLQAQAEIDQETNIRLHYDDVKEKSHTQAGLNGSNGEMVRTMLEAAKQDPDEWYKKMVSIQLFGQEAKGIRPEFAAKLKEAEKLTCAKLAEEDAHLSNPRIAGQYLGINESYKTSRVFKSDDPGYQSMHLFGLAIDINYFNNPWITQKTEKKAPFKKFTSNIDALFNTSTTAGYSYTDAQTKVKDAEALGTIFDGLNAIDKNVERYFALIDNEEALKEAIAASTSKDWNTLTPAKAKKKIKADLATMSSQFSRGGGKSGNVKKHGIMDLDRRLVVSMGEVGLDWGGKYGDMMHFDMRFEGIGDTVNKTKGTSKVSKLKAKLKGTE